MHEREHNERPAHENVAPDRDQATDASDGWPPPRRPRIYVAWDSHHPSGIGQGTWIDAAQSPDELRTAIETFVAATATPETTRWSIRDAEDFGVVPLDTFASVEAVTLVAGDIVEHGRAFAACMANIGITDPELGGPCHDAFLGSWSSPEDFSATVVSTLGLPQLLDIAVPEALREYVVVDGVRLLRDLHHDGLFTVVGQPGGGVWVFEGKP